MIDGCSLKCAGGSLEVLGNGVSRWMTVAHGQCLWEQNPAYGWLIYRFLGLAETPALSVMESFHSVGKNFSHLETI